MGEILEFRTNKRKKSHEEELNSFKVINMPKRDNRPKATKREEKDLLRKFNSLFDEDWVSAIKMLEEFEKNHQVSNDILKAIGSAYLYYDNIYNAQEYYEKALVNNPKDLSIYFKLSQAYTEKGDYKKAEEYLKMAQKQNSFNPNIHYELGRLHYEEGNDKKAIRHFEHSKSLIYKQKNPHLYLIDYINDSLMDLYFSSSQYEKVIELGKQLQNEDGFEYETNLYYLAFSNKLLDKNDEAIKWYKEILKVNPDNLAAVLGIAEILIEGKKYNQARDLLVEKKAEITNESYLSSINQIISELDKNIRQQVKDMMKQNSPPKNK